MENLNKLNLVSLMDRKGVENILVITFQIFLNVHLNAVNVKVKESPIRIILLLNLMFIFWWVSSVFIIFV